MAPEPLVVELKFAADPWSVAQKLSGLPHLLLLDSAGGPAELTRYSYVAADPFRWLQMGDERGPNPFDDLEDALRYRKTELLTGLPPFQGGAAGLFGYGLCRWFERVPRPRIEDFWHFFHDAELSVGL